MKADFSEKEKRFADFDLLIKKVYEDNAMGKLPDRRYEMLSSDYEKEQQEIEIFLNYIGRVELPAQELSGEEMAEEEKKRKCRQYRREYMKAYREKHRSEIRRVIEGANAVDKQRQIIGDCGILLEEQIGGECYVFESYFVKRSIQ